MNGIKVNDRTIHMARLSKRKRLCLVIQDGKKATVVASFKNEKCAQLFWEQVDKMILDITKGGAILNDMSVQKSDSTSA